VKAFVKLVWYPALVLIHIPVYVAILVSVVPFGPPSAVDYGFGTALGTILAIMWPVADTMFLLGLVGAGIYHIVH
jgi:hypothetical protein